MKKTKVKEKSKSENSNSILFKINTKIYPLECILNTAYLYLDKIYFFVDGDPKNELKITIKRKENVTIKELDKIYGEFNNELINQLLRIKLSKQNKKIQEYIVGKALFGLTPVSDNESDCEINQNVNNITKDEEALDKMLSDEIAALEAEEKKHKNCEDPLGILDSWDKKTVDEK